MLDLKRKIWIIIGTRPELIKQLPVYYECVKKFGKRNIVLINSGQHKKFLGFYTKENKIKFDLIINNLESTKSLVKNISPSSILLLNFLIINLTCVEKVPVNKVTPLV